MRRFYICFAAISSLFCVNNMIAQNVEEKKVYDFEADQIYYNILSKDGKSVEVTTGNKDLYIPIGKPSLTPLPEQGTSPMEWQGCSYEGEVRIPDKVEHEGVEYSVTTIGEGAFVHCSRLKSIILPESIETIGSLSFCKANGLETVSLPSSLKTIEEGAFYQCYGLVEVKWAENVTAIPSLCFYELGVDPIDCVVNPQKFNLTNYSAVEEIGDQAFYHSTIERFNFEETAVRRTDNIGDYIFSESMIEEITLPPDWENDEYAPLLTKLLGSLPAELSTLILNRPTPPDVDASEVAIPDEAFTQITLSVPAGSEDTYRQSAFWSRFSKIQTSGIDVAVEEPASDTPAEYYRVDGVKVAGEPLHGIYIRRQGGKAEKVIL